MRISGRLKTLFKFKSRKIQLSTGDALRIKVRRDLLTSAGKEIAGILHLNGMEIYIPKDEIISIGNSRKDDIRIKDPAIGKEHLMISSIGEGLRVENLDPIRNVAIGETKLDDISLLSGTNLKGKTVNNELNLAFKLSGIKGDGNPRVLTMKLEEAKETDNAMKAALEILLRPPIEDISPELAMARAKRNQAAANIRTIDGPINPKAVEGTIFEGVKTISELIEVYYWNYKKAEAIAKKYATAAGYLSLLSSASAIATGLFALFTNLIHSSPIIALSTGCFAPALGFMGTSLLRGLGRVTKQEVNDIFSKVLSHLKTDQITKILAAIETQEREEIIAAFEKIDSVRVEKVKRELPAAIDAVLSRQGTAESSQDLSADEEKPPTTVLAGMKAELDAEDGRDADGLDQEPEEEIEED